MMPNDTDNVNTLEPTRLPKPWVFNSDGGSVEGHIVDYLTARANDGREVPALVLELGDGTKRSVWCWPAVLRRKVEEIAPKAGQYISIEQGEERVTQDGERHYHLFDVDVR
jgi:hypothetical protein